MAQTLSSVITNNQARPKVYNDKALLDSILYCSRVKMAMPDTSDADTVILIPIHVDAVIKDFTITFSDCGTAGLANIGFYKERIIAGVLDYVAVSADCIASAVDMSTAAASALVPQRFNGLATDSMFSRAWEIAGLIAKPNYSQFYIGIVTSTGTTTTGTVAIDVTYTR